MTQAPSDSQLAGIAADILGEPIEKATPAQGGGNNRIYKIDAKSGLYTLKFYPSQSEDPRDRLGQEFDALSFLSAHGVKQIPQPVGRRQDEQCAMYQWIEGERVAGIGETEVDALASFLVDLQALRDEDGADQLRDASARCFRVCDVSEQLHARLKRLEKVAANFDDLNVFLTENLRPSIEKEIAAVEQRCTDLGIGYTASLPRAKQALSPSDFGFHNALRDGTGRIAFIDFEYFGWDDPVKMISDVMWHPAMNLSPSLANRFAERVSAYFAPRDDQFSLRRELLFPLFGLIWCMILLNEFLPESWARREAAGHDNATQCRKRQLDKALTLYQRLKS